MLGNSIGTRPRRKKKTEAKQTTITPTVPSRAVGLVKRIIQIERHVNRNVLERQEETRSAILALLSRQSCFFIGDVGAGKTMHVELLCAMFQLDLFDVLMSETTKPETIFGPIDVPALANGTQRVKVKGYAPTANVLFLDEMFKASDVVLNPLLWLLNERKYRNGDDGVIDCPLITSFAASNEVSSDTGLRALYDRFLIRHSVEYVQTADNLGKMVRAFIGHDASKYETPEKLSLEDVHLAIDLCKLVKLPDSVWKVALNIRKTVQGSTGVVISDRRLLRAMKVAQASAFLNGRDEIELHDLYVLGNIFWDKPTDSKTVKTIVSSFTSDVTTDLQTIIETANHEFQKATERGELTEGMRNLKTLYKRLKRQTVTFELLEVRRTVMSYFEQLKAIREDRKGITIIQVNAGRGCILKLSPADQPNWNPAELRSAGFKFSRSKNYYRIDSGTLKKKAIDKLIARVENQLGCTVTLTNP